MIQVSGPYKQNYKNTRIQFTPRRCKDLLKFDFGEFVQTRLRHFQECDDCEHFAYEESIMDIIESCQYLAGETELNTSCSKYNHASEYNHNKLSSFADYKIVMYLECEINLHKMNKNGYVNKYHNVRKYNEKHIDNNRYNYTDYYTTGDTVFKEFASANFGYDLSEIIKLEYSDQYYHDDAYYELMEWFTLTYGIKNTLSYMLYFNEIYKLFDNDWLHTDIFQRVIEKDFNIEKLAERGIFQFIRCIKRHIRACHVGFYDKYPDREAFSKSYIELVEGEEDYYASGAWLKDLFIPGTYMKYRYQPIY